MSKMSEELKNLLYFDFGRRTLWKGQGFAVMLAVIQSPDTMAVPVVATAVCVEEREGFLHLKATDEKCVFGPITSGYFISLGFEKSAQLLNACAHPGITYSAAGPIIRAQIGVGPALCELGMKFTGGIEKWCDVSSCKGNKVYRPIVMPSCVATIEQCNTHVQLGFCQEPSLSELDLVVEIIRLSRAVIRALVGVHWRKAVHAMKNGESYELILYNKVTHQSDIHPMLLDSVKLFTDAEQTCLWNNMMAPRFIVVASDVSWVARANRNLLLQAGDVETNPGPNLFDVVFQIVVHYWRVYVIMPVENKAWDCALLQEEARFWRVELSDWSTVRMWVWMRQFIHKAHPANLYEPDLGCTLVEKFWGLPDVPRFDAIGSWWWWFKSVTVAACFLWVFWVAVALVFWWRWSRRVGPVMVHNSNGGININEIKEVFTTKSSDHLPPRHQKGKHVLLADQRRFCEQVCINWLLERFRRFRDVGGSRTRWSNLGFKKHLCCPQTCNDDILRELKSDTTFDNCGFVGQLCPLRGELPGAILSHVDYHMTQDELTETITGPTFIINHPFHQLPSGLGEYEGGFEAKVSYKGGIVTMTTDDGTPFVHGFHDWRNEGTVIGKNRAFVYTRVLKHLDTCVYFCYPASGVYARSDPNAMSKTRSDALPMIDGCKVIRDADEYVFSRVGFEYRVSVEPVDETAATMSTAIRDDKWFDTLRSCLIGKLKANRSDMTQLALVLRLTAWVSDINAVYTVPFATCLSGHPVDFRPFDIIWYRFVLWGRKILPTAVVALLYWWVETKTYARYGEWTFPKVIVPTYEVYSRGCDAISTSKASSRFASEKFRPTAPPDNASGNQQPECGAGKNHRKHDHIFVDESPEYRPKTPTAPVRNLGTEPVFSRNVGSPFVAAPINPIQPPVRPPRFGETRINDERPGQSCGFEGFGNHNRDRIATTPIVSTNPFVSGGILPGTVKSVPVKSNVVLPIIVTYKPEVGLPKIVRVEVNGKNTEIHLKECYRFILQQLSDEQIVNFSIWVEEILDKVDARQMYGDDCATTIKRIIEHGLSGRVGEYGWTIGNKGTRILLHPITTVDGGVERPDAFSRMGATVSSGATGTVNGGQGQSFAAGSVSERRSRQELPKNRDLYKPHRSKKY